MRRFLRFLIKRQVPFSRLFLRLFCPHSSDDQALNASVLIQDTFIGEMGLFLVGHRVIEPPTFVGHIHEADATIVCNRHQIFDRMLLLLATETNPLFTRIARPVYRSFGAIAEKTVTPWELCAGAGSEHWRRAVRDGRFPYVPAQIRVN
jgi:hypothetical protein